MDIIEVAVVERTIRSPESLEGVVQHWAKTRIDGPLDAMARFDEAARQLIIIGGVMQTVVFAVLGLSEMKARIPVALVPIALFPLLLLVIFAAKVICTVPMKMEAIDTYLLALKLGDAPGLPEHELTDAVRRWCLQVDDIIRRKHRWLLCANIAFWITSASTAVCLVLLLRPAGLR